MPRRNGEKFVFDDGEDEDTKDPAAMKDEEEDDDEGNEDLSLKILEKALSRNKHDSSTSDLSDSGVVSMNNGGNSKAKKAESSIKKKKKMKKIKIEAPHENEKVVEDVIKGEEEDDKSPDEPKTEEPSSNMVLKKLLRGARYFDPPEAGLSCYSCGEQGHITMNCPTPSKRRKPCFICGSLEHGARQCSKGHDCYICKKTGHRAKDCPDKYKSGSKAALCLRCGDFGHDMILCKYEYSKEDLKDIQCYVCKSFGHLCCVEPGNSPTWAVSCYRCGQLGHTGLGCGRHYDESNETDYVSPSCFKCGEDGHFKRDCPNPSSFRFPENKRESEATAVCFRCGEEGHFSRECPNSSSISTSQGREYSSSLCYKCSGAGHFARECPNSSQVSKRHREPSTPSHKSHKKNRVDSEHNSAPHESISSRTRRRNKENSEHNSAPHESNGKTKKKKKTNKEDEHPKASPRKSKQRGGWITEEPEEEYFQRGKMRRPRSPVTPSTYNHRSPTLSSGGHYQGSQSTTPHGRNHRNSAFESSRHLSGPSPSRWQPSYSPSHQHHHYHQQHHRYEPSPSTPSRYGGAHHHGEYAGNHHGRW